MALQYSDGENMLLEGFRALRSVNSRTLTVVSDPNTGNVNFSFVASLMSQQDVIDLDNELGHDGRDWMIAEVERPIPGQTAWSPTSISVNATISDGINNWRFVKMTDNAADVTVRLWFVQLVPDKDA